MSDRGRGRPPGTTHDEIRDVALRLFLERGYAKTSLADIARAAGISRTTLFAYFPSKRDMIWQDFDHLAADMDATLAETPARPVVDLILRAMLVNARYGVEDHTVMASRMRVVAQDSELRAYAALAVKDTTDRIAAAAAERTPGADPETVDLVTRALIAAASQCTETWAAQEHPEHDLASYTLARIRPIADALRPLLP